MKSFSLHHPKTLDEAVKLLPQGSDRKERERTRILAGGQDLLTEMKEHLAEPERLVALGGIEGLDRIEPADGGGFSIGALVTIAELEENVQVREELAVLHEAARSIASPQIRSQGTVGGNLCQRPRCWYYRSEHAKCLKKGGVECFSYGGLNKYNAILGGGPSYIVHPSDLAPALVALEARIHLHGPSGERVVSLERFFTLPSEASVLRETVLAQDEIVTKIEVPAQPAGMRSTYLKFKERGSYDFALAAVAVAVWMEGGKIARARLVLGGVAPIPWRCVSTEELLAGRALDLDTMKAAAEDALADAEPLEHNGYKVPLAKGLIRRAMERLARA